MLAYVLNFRIAFRAQHRGDSPATLARFAATFASSALLSAIVFSLVRLLLALMLPGSALVLVGARGASIVTVIIWNFTLLRLWVFPVQDRRSHNA
jgi:putative flippase GtrA